MDAKWARIWWERPVIRQISRRVASSQEETGVRRVSMGWDSSEIAFFEIWTLIGPWIFGKPPF